MEDSYIPQCLVYKQWQTTFMHTAVYTSTYMAKISIQNLYFTYGDDTKALQNISLDIYENEIFVLFGPARSGKTTLLRLLNRLEDTAPSLKMKKPPNLDDFFFLLPRSGLVQL